MGLPIYGTLVVTHVDNVVRFVMQKKLADTHPLVTILGVLIGLPLFGFMGVIFGPLLLEMFVFFVHIFKKKYLDGLPDRELFRPRRHIRRGCRRFPSFYGKRPFPVFFVKNPCKIVGI